MTIKGNLRNAVATVTAITAAVFVVDDRYATAADLLKVEAVIKTELSRKADRVIIEALIKSAHAQKIRELKREQWRINNKKVLNDADRYMLQDIETDIELLEE